MPTVLVDSHDTALDLALFLLRAGARVALSGASVGVGLPGALDDAKERAELIAYLETWSSLKGGAVRWELSD